VGPFIEEFQMSSTGLELRAEHTGFRRLRVFLSVAVISGLALVSSQAWSQTCTSTVDKTVKICSPVSGSTDTSPVTFNAGALDKEHTVTAMALYVDSTEKGSSKNNHLLAALSLPAGKHTIVIRAWDSTGFAFFTQETFTAKTASPTPTPTPTPAPTPSPTPTATPTPTPGPSGITAINHIILVLQENRSFDSYFGMLNPYRRARGWNVGDDQHVYDVDGIDDKLTTVANKDDEGTFFSLFHTTSSCLDDMTSSWLESYGDISRFDFTTTRKMLMDGFVHTAEGYAKSGVGSGAFTDTTGERSMAFYADTTASGAPELNYYYFMASQFALSDRWFSPVSSKTIPNRLATMCLILGWMTMLHNSRQRQFSSSWTSITYRGRFTIRISTPTEVLRPHLNILVIAGSTFQRMLRAPSWWMQRT
jgi:hypothetical protein